MLFQSRFHQTSESYIPVGLSIMLLHNTLTFVMQRACAVGLSLTTSAPFRLAPFHLSTWRRLQKRFYPYCSCQAHYSHGHALLNPETLLGLVYQVSYGKQLSLEWKLLSFTPLFLPLVLYFPFYSLALERKKTRHYIVGNTQVNACKHYAIVCVHKP